MVTLSFGEISERLKQADLPETDIGIGIGTGVIVHAGIGIFQVRLGVVIVDVDNKCALKTS